MKKFIIGIFINLISIYFTFVIQYIIFDFQYGYYFSQALGNMVYLSPVILGFILFIFYIDFLYYKPKKRQWVFVETVLVYLISIIYILLGNFGMLEEKIVFLASFLFLFLCSQILKFVLYNKLL